MKNKSIAVAYPTIPIIFVASVNEKRVPLHDTMGLAVTDLKEETRSETIVEAVAKEGIRFLLEGKRVAKKRERDIQMVAKEFMKAAGKEVGLKIQSKNYKIFSGSSDSGAAALVTTLDDFFETKFPKEKLAGLANRISESAIRSVYGGLNIYVVSKGKPYGVQLASEKDLRKIKIFAMGFDYETRVSAQEIFEICKASPYWKMRLERVPYWVREIKEGLKKRDWKRVFSNAEENCANAHYLIESGGKRCRKKEMMTAVIDVEEIRLSGLPVYWTAGGGNLINAITWEPYGERVLKELKKRGQNPIEYKVASGPKIIKSEY